MANEPEKKNLHPRDAEKFEKWALLAGKLTTKIKTAEKSLEEELAKEKSVLKEVKARLQKYFINKEEGEARRKSEDGSVLAVAHYMQKYKIYDRQKLYDFITEPLEDLKGTIPGVEEAIKEIQERMDIFGNTLAKEAQDNYRKATGATKEGDKLVGGDLMPGTGMNIIKDVRFYLSGDNNE